ncbi:MAG: hypothetical protein IPM84_23225 [Anaerolineae bacterium]|nr:hypothetical protein [Anaerolineae bacterium]
MTATLDTALRGPAARLPTQRRTSLNITAALDAKLVQMAGRTRLTKTAILEAALDSYHAVVMKSPDMTLGYIQATHPGDLAPENTDCSRCEQPCHPGGLWFTVGLTHNQLSSAARSAPAAQPKSNPMATEITPYTDQSQPNPRRRNRVHRGEVEAIWNYRPLKQAIF